MSKEELEEAVGYLKLLADETRLRLLGCLAARERSVGELAEIVGLREPTISHHLARLTGAGLVSARAEGTARIYRLERDTLTRIGRELFTPERVRGYADEGADAFERKVLGTFLDGERLTKIPDTRKKRDVILRWLVERFEPDRTTRNAR
jgi:DNA-binding transcriptional ArsR family regulator